MVPVQAHQADGLPRRRVLVLGGARSGKSTYAENLARRWSTSVTYVATSRTRSDDPEWDERVAAHRARRPAHWSTVETRDLSSVINAAQTADTVLVDCMTLWLTGAMDDVDAWSRADVSAVTDEVMHEVALVTESLSLSAANVVIVSNEVGWGVVPASASGRLFRDLSGRMNTTLAEVCDDAVLIVAGRALPLERVP